MVTVCNIPEEHTGPGSSYVGRIPVRNLWLLLLYASELYRSLGNDHVDKENNPDDLPNLIAEILAYAVEERQRRQLSLDYRMEEAVLHRVRGRIDVLTTERHQLLARGMVACKFENLTIDTLRNRFVRAALETISRLASRQNLIHRCRKLASDMRAMGVSGTPPTRLQMSSERFGRHDAPDRYMVAAAKLAFDFALPTEVAGSNALPLPDREEVWARRLFEHAVGGFFRVVLPRKEWSVATGKRINWQVHKGTPGIKSILPNMQTDIVLNHAISGRRIVIDTNFNSILTSGWHRDQTLRSGYLYQVYAYLRSQVGQGDSSADRAEGLLLHPSVGESIDETAIIQGHGIRFATVDLTASTSTIREQLLRSIKPTCGQDSMN